MLYFKRTSNRVAMLLLATCSSLSHSQESQRVAAPVASTDVDGVIEEYCIKCHNFEDYAGGIDLEGLEIDNVQTVAEVGEKVIRRLRAGMMPPVGEPRPDAGTMNALAAALETAMDETAVIKPGRPGIRRLNRTEYQNAIRDLVGLDIDVAELLPADDSSRGFDNQAASLVVSPALLEAYVSTATKISQLALGTVSNASQKLYRLPDDANQNFRIEGLPLGTRGGIKFTHIFPVDGEYSLKIFPVSQRGNFNARPFGHIEGEKLEVLVDGQMVKMFDWDSAFNAPRGSSENDEEDGKFLPALELSIPLSAGPHEIGVTFLATNFAPTLDMNNDFERSKIETGRIAGYTFYPHVDSVRVDGPFADTGTSSTPSRQKIFTCFPESAEQELDCAREIIGGMMDVAYRGYGSEADLDVLMEFYSIGRETGTFDSGIEIALQRILASPKFIYRVEREPEDVAVGEVYPISDLDLASRLSFFLWSSIPDRELLDLAEAGKLSEPAILDQQVRRMLDDPKSMALTENFAGQWLALRNLEAHVPVVNEFPDFDDLLRESFRRETELFFDTLIRENRPVTELLTADFTFVNERLAGHYGIPDIRGLRFRRVSLEGDLSVRQGILGKGSFLTVSSQPGRTSPVMRGYFVLSNIIGVEPPPPPPNVPALETRPEDLAGNAELPSMREQMAEHRSNPACEGCHRLMDPIGFALETFDAVGKYRTVANGHPIDTAGTLYNGTEIETSEDLVGFLLQYEESIVRNVTEKLLTYALGRGMEFTDMPLVRDVQHEAAQDGYRFQSLISAVVRSDAFLKNVKVGSALPATASNDAIRPRD